MGFNSTFSIIKMGKIMKKGRVVILLAGRLSGKKAIIIKQNDEGKKNRKFPHALVAGVERSPRKVTKKMSKKKVERKSTIKPFVKYVNYNHLLATRFIIKDDFDFKNIVTDDAMEDPAQGQIAGQVLAPRGPRRKTTNGRFPLHQTQILSSLTVSSGRPIQQWRAETWPKPALMASQLWQQSCVR